MASLKDSITGMHLFLPLLHIKCAPRLKRANHHKQICTPNIHTTPHTRIHLPTHTPHTHIPYSHTTHPHPLLTHSHPHTFPPTHTYHAHIPHHMTTSMTNAHLQHLIRRGLDTRHHVGGTESDLLHLGQIYAMQTCQIIIVISMLYT